MRPVQRSHRWLKLALLSAAMVALTGPKLFAAPALVVVISIDQFRYDYLPRFREHFSDGGFNLFLKHGADFADCHFRHSSTKTGPGHAVMLTGVHANLHGIIANDWIDRNTFERVSCVGDKDVEILGLPPISGPVLPGIGDPRMGRSPKNLLVTTVGDELKLDRGGRPKVIGISNKDRAAILMSGKMADAAYYMERGRMVSSTYYMPSLPDWVQAWNAAGKADAYFGKVWDRALPAESYLVQGPDDMPGEAKSSSGNTLPKKIDGGETAPGPKFYAAFEDTPFSNEVLVDFTEAAIVNERLGGHPGITDLLCVSFSGHDHIGHLYGPDSHEIMDNVIRMDRTLDQFFRFLDKRLGLARCLIVLTADHGAMPIPEWVHRLRAEVPASRDFGAAALSAVEAALNQTYGPRINKARWTLRDDTSFLIYPDALKEKGLESAAVQQLIRDTLQSLDSVQAAYTRTQLETGEASGELGRRAVLSFNRARSGDVFFQAKPFFFDRVSGATHGSPYNYDTHVPLLWYGAGVKAGVHTERVGVDDLAPTLAHLLGLPAPPLAEGRVLF